MKVDKERMKYLGISLLILMLIFFIASQYTGGAYFLKATLIPYEFLTITTLYDNWFAYIDNPAFEKILRTAVLITYITFFVPTFIVIFFFVILIKTEEIHGSARFANTKELKKSGLFPTDSERKTPSILLGKMNRGYFKNRYVELTGQLFAGVGAPTRSGKGVGLVIPNLVTFSHSVVVQDIKLENFEKTAGYRQKNGHKVFLFCPNGYNPSGIDDPDNLRTHRWNPYDYVRRDAAFKVGDLLVMTGSLYPIAGDSKNDLWNELAGKLFKGLSTWMIDTEKLTNQTPTLPYLLSLTGVEGGLENWMRRELAKSYIGDDTALEFNNFINAPEETRGSILINLVGPLAVFTDVVAAKSVSASDFNFNDLRKEKIALYVGVRPGTLNKFKKLLNLFYEQLINENTKVLPENDPALKYQCLCLMDELTAVGRIQQIADSISFTAGYNLRFLMIYQNEAQLEDPKNYGKDGAKNILMNLAVKVIFPPKEVDDSVKRLSETLGTKTVRVASHSNSQGKTTSKTYNTSPQKRPLMMPHEIIELGMELHPKAPLGMKTLLVKENQRAFIMEKIIYFDEPILLSRVNYSMANIPEIPKLQF